MRSSRPHVLMLFLDGVGIGTKDPARNPFFGLELPALNALLGGNMVHKRDARRALPGMSLVPLNTALGVSGLPQSGTGQAALLTGLNAPRIVGKHFGPYLYSTLKPLVCERNIFRTLRRAGKKVFYANAFPHQYFDYLKARNSHVPVVSYSWLCSGKPLNDATHLLRGKALSADITNQRWAKLGYPEIPTISPREAGMRLVELTEHFDFVLYEYYYTDHAGHSQSMEEVKEVLQKLNGLIEGILESIAFKNMLLVVTSDHGNLEELSVKTHTRNPVPLMAVGFRHDEITRSAKNLTDVMPGIMRILQ